MSSYAVILAGGKGERFWPLSTAAKPKQLLSLVGDRSLLAQAVLRLEGLVPPERIFVLTNADLVDACRASVPELPPEQIIGEPVGRDTAAAVALATALVKARDPEAVFAILTADHVMGDLPLYRRTLASAFGIASSGDHLVTIGIRPNEPSTAYGYIERGSAREGGDGIRFYDVVRFVEKPPVEKATEYLASGRYYWNSGMFVWSVGSIHRAFRAHRPALAAMIDRLVPVCGTAGFPAVLAQEFGGLEKISIDYAVMEKSRNILVAEGTFAWDDVGSWTALQNHFAQDAGGNTVIGEGYEVDARNNIVFSRDRVTALVGVEDLIVVQADGATLVCRKDRAQDIKRLLAEIRAKGAADRLSDGAAPRSRSRHATGRSGDLRSRAPVRVAARDDRGVVRGGGGDEDRAGGEGAGAGATEIVLGQPVNMDGSLGPAARHAESVARALAQRLGIPVHLWDERLTTHEAHDMLRDAGKSSRKRKGVVDRVAAQLILQSYIDAHPSS